ncbi:MAG: phosphatase PAP2 family protein [Nocardioidaceae bacterium]
MTVDSGSRTVVARRTSLGALVTVAASAVALFVVQYLALRTPRGQRWDERVFQAGTTRPWSAWSWPTRVLADLTLGLAIAVAVAAVLFALLRRRWYAAVAAAVLVAGANLSTQILKKDVLTRLNLGVPASNSLPSGHVTAVTSTALAALVVAPLLFRLVLSAATSAAAVLVAYSTLVEGWHRVSDVLAALLVCVFWGCLVLSFRPASPGASSAAARRRAVVAGFAGGVVTAVVLVVLSALRGPGTVVEHPARSLAVAAAVAGIGCLAGLVSALVSYFASHPGSEEPVLAS